MKKERNSTESQKGMGRRNFVRATALTGGAFAVSPTLFGMGSKYRHLWADLPEISEKRKLGSLEVSSMGLGCMNMAGIYNDPMPKDAMVAVIQEAIEKGVTFLDTAEVYGPYLSEEMVGAAVKGKRDKVVIATKFGFDFDNGRVVGRSSRPENIKKALDGCLKRLQTDYIDLFYLHRNDPSVPIEDIAGTVGDMIKEGKVRAFGLSEVSPETIRKAHAEQPVSALQSEYSMLERVIEHQVLDTCEELGIGFVPWGPVARGFLTDRFQPDTPVSHRRAQVSYFTEEARKNNMALLNVVKDWAKRKDCTPAQISIAWLQAQKPWIVPIPGTTNPKHLAENLGGEGVKFSTEELKGIRASIEGLQLMGMRDTDSVLSDL